MSWSIRRKLGGAPVATATSADGVDARDHLLPTSRLEAFSDGVFAIAITLLVLELHVPTAQEALVKGLEHEWPRYLGYFVSFAFIGGVWIAHSNLTRFIKAIDSDLMRLNLILLLFVSFLPFTTAIVATHLFASNLTLHEVTVSSSAERVAVVLFGLNLTLAALMLYLMLRHAGRTPNVAANDLAEEELRAFGTQRRSATLLQASATVVGAFLPLLAVIFYLALAIFYIIDPVRLMRTHGHGRARIKGMPAGNLRATASAPPPTWSDEGDLAQAAPGEVRSRGQARRLIGLGWADKIMTGWGSMAKTAEEAEAVIERLNRASGQVARG